MGYRRREVVSPRRGFAGDEAEGGGGSGERVGRNREEVVWGAEWEERVPRVLLREREGRLGAPQALATRGRRDGGGTRMVRVVSSRGGGQHEGRWDQRVVEVPRDARKAAGGQLARRNGRP